MDSQDELKNEKRWLLPLLLVVAILIWLSNWVAVIHFMPEDWPYRGQFGDMFGAANALFTALAFAGFIYAIYLQRQDLHLQRKELKLTRNEIQGQREQMQLQNRTLSLQQFENTFFQLMDLFNELVRNLEDRSEGLKGKACFNKWYSRFRWKYDDTVRKMGPSISDDTKLLEIAHNQFSSGFPLDISNYFKTLYHLLWFVDRSSIVDKEFYATLVRAQISDDEKYMIFYYCLTPNYRELKAYVEKFGLFQLLKKSKLVNQDHYNHYDATAYSE